MKKQSTGSVGGDKQWTIQGKGPVAVSYMGVGWNKQVLDMPGALPYIDMPGALPYTITTYLSMWQSTHSCCWLARESSWNNKWSPATEICSSGENGWWFRWCLYGILMSFPLSKFYPSQPSPPNLHSQLATLSISMACFLTILLALTSLLIQPNIWIREGTVYSVPAQPFHPHQYVLNIQCWWTENHPLHCSLWAYIWRCPCSWSELLV